MPHPRSPLSSRGTAPIRHKDVEDVSENFDALAAYLADRIGEDPAAGKEIAMALFNAWNARGRADRRAIEASLVSQLGCTAARVPLKNLERALKALDR